MARSRTALQKPPQRKPSETRSAISVAVANRQRRHTVDKRLLIHAVQTVLRVEKIEQGEISIAIVSDKAIHEINRRFLAHDEPTDVISFLLEHRPGYIEGEIVASADTAAAAARRFKTTPADELLLYIIHGTLHLIGYDDLSAGDRKTMHTRQRKYLEQIKRKPKP
ncbi:MAG TPA: rRNA maturation RNase YbeY [Pirellulales bacterium]|jgi:probable rRNA maturation factor